MKRKLLYTIFFLLLMVCSLSAISSADWQTDEKGDTYYYKDETPESKLTLGPHTIDGKQYLFKKTGRLIEGAATAFRNHIYVSRDDGSLITTVCRYNGDLYYGTSSGYCKRGLVLYKKNYYYFDKETAIAAKDSWVTVDGKTYYFGSNNRAYKGKFYDIKDQTYYFNSKGVLQKTGLTKIGSDYYFLSKKNGRMVTGSLKIGKYYYYFDASKTTKRGKALKNSWKKIDGKYYYYGSDYRRKTGWFISGTKRYYLDPSKNGARTYGQKTISGVSYNFGTKGYVTTPKLSGNKLVLRVNRKQCVVTAYDNGVPVKAMTCSTGASGCSTPTGTYFIQDHLAWWMLNGPSYGQYCSHFLPSYLFHSVPVYGTSRNPYGVNASDYNRLGTPASGGCIRLSVADAKWIYYNAPIGSTVIISDSEPMPLGKPATKKMKAGTKGADPTDDFKNPAGYDV